MFARKRVWSSLVCAVVLTGAGDSVAACTCDACVCGVRIHVLVLPCPMAAFGLIFGRWFWCVRQVSTVCYVINSPLADLRYGRVRCQLCRLSMPTIPILWQNRLLAFVENPGGVRIIRTRFQGSVFSAFQVIGVAGFALLLSRANRDHEVFLRESFS